MVFDQRLRLLPHRILNFDSWSMSDDMWPITWDLSPFSSQKQTLASKRRRHKSAAVMSLNTTPSQRPTSQDDIQVYRQVILLSIFRSVVLIFLPGMKIFRFLPKFRFENSESWVLNSKKSFRPAASKIGRPMFRFPNSSPFSCLNMLFSIFVNFFELFTFSCFQIENVESKRALILLMPPEATDQQDFDIEPQDFKYELWLSDKGREGKYKLVYRYVW